MLKSPIDGGPHSNRIPVIKAHGIISAYQKIGYKGVAVSSSDLSLGLSFFTSEAVHSFPFISANVVREDGKLLFHPFVVVEINGLHLGIVGLTDTANPAPNGLIIGDWQESLQAQLASLQPQCEMIIALSTLSPEENQLLAQKFPQVSIIVTANLKNTNRRPHLVNRSLITSLTGRGKYIGQLDIWYRPGAKGWIMQSGPDSGELKKRIQSAENRLKELQQNDIKPPSSLNTQKIKRMQVHIRALKTRLALVIQQQQEISANSFESKFHAVPPVKSRTEVDNIINGIRASITAYNKLKASAIPESNSNLQKELEREIYAGSSRCKECHIKQFRSWQNHPHSRAYTTLVQRGQEYNPECLVCHVTAGSRITETSSDAQKTLLLSLPEERRSVGCESCHGPGSAHCNTPDTYLPTRTPQPEICLACHTSQRDNDFSFAKKLSLLHCTKE